MKKHTGFSLIELMVTLAFAGIILSVGVPQLNEFFRGNRMVSNTNELISGLHIARSEAIKRGLRVTMCKSANAGDPAPSCTTSGGWEQGWFVFVDGGVIGDYNSSDDGPLLKIGIGALGNNVTINTDNTSSGTAIDHYISYTSRGIPKTSSGSGQSGIFKICDDRGLKNAAGNVIGRGVVVSPSGRARFTTDETKIVSCL